MTELLVPQLNADTDHVSASNWPAMYVVFQSVLSLLSSGLTTGVVMYSGGGMLRSTVCCHTIGRPSVYNVEQVPSDPKGAKNGRDLRCGFDSSPALITNHTISMLCLLSYCAMSWKRFWQVARFDVC